MSDLFAGLNSARRGASPSSPVGAARRRVYISRRYVSLFGRVSVSDRRRRTHATSELQFNPTGSVDSDEVDSATGK